MEKSYSEVKKNFRLYRAGRYLNAGTITRLLTLVLICAMLMSIGGCKDPFQYSPAEVALAPDEQNLNAINITKVKQMEKDTFSFALFGDSQRFYDDLRDFVIDANVRKPDFVILAGDLTDFGQLKEYRWIVRELKKLEMPFIAVPGNHDLLANGPEVFRQMFGPLDFTFNCGKTRFVALNTNSQEYGFDGRIPDITFLESALADHDGYDRAFIVSHIPPFDKDFDQTLSAKYVKALNDCGKVQYSLHGHQHKYSLSSPYDDGISYLVTASMQKRGYAMIHVTGQETATEEIHF